MLSLIESIFGTYVPVTYQVYDAATQAYESVIPSGSAGVDWPYVLGVLGFFLMLYCIMRLIGGVFHGK